MQPIEYLALQGALNERAGLEQYLHLETTPGAYAAMRDEKAFPVAAFVRNARVHIARATLAGHGPYRVGLKIDGGWVYADGLTDWEVDAHGRLLMAGHDPEGRLAVALQLGDAPFGRQEDTE